MILITGAQGFVGSHLLPALKEARAFRGDICSPAAVDRQVSGCSAIIHLAAYQGNDAVLAEKINVRGTSNLIRAARKYRINHFIFLSSEYVLDAYQTPYSRTKAKAEKVVRAFPNHLILRSAVMYGSRDTKSIARLIAAVQRFPVIPIIGSGVLQPIHVDDVVQYIKNGLARNIRGTHLIAGKLVTMRHLIHAIARTLHKRVVVVSFPRAAISLIRLIEPVLPLPLTSAQAYYMSRAKVYDIAPAVSACHHAPMPIEAGLRKTISPLHKSL